MRIAVPFTPSGTTDIVAHALGAEPQGALGQPVVVESGGVRRAGRPHADDGRIAARAR